MTPQEHARARAVSTLTAMVRTLVPNLGEESRDRVREWIEHAVDELIADCAVPEPSAPEDRR